MSFVIGLVLLAALGYVGYRFLVRKQELDVLPVKNDAEVPAPVVEVAPPAVSHVSENHSVEVQNTEEPAPAAAPKSKAKGKAKAKTSAPKKAKKPKLEVAK